MIKPLLIFIGAAILSFSAYKYAVDVPQQILGTVVPALQNNTKTTTLATSKVTDDIVTEKYNGGKKVINNITLSPLNTVVLAGEIGENAIEVAQQINSMSKSGKPMFLLINSPGGSILDGNQIVDAIQAARGPVYTVCLSLCASMAAIILEAGTQRLMQDRSIVMFHEAAGSFGGPFNQMASRFKTFSRLVNKADYEIAQRVGMKYEDFKALLPNELWLDAEDAVAQHFADKIVNVNLVLTSFQSPQEKVKFSEILSQTKNLNKKMYINLGN